MSNKKTSFSECFCLDDKRYRFIETITVSVEKKEREHLPLGEDRRLPLAREYFNPDDQNSIRIGRNFLFASETIGYIPKELARVLAPKMDAGTNYVGWVKNTDSKDNVIQIDIYERIIVPFSEIKRFSFTTWGYLVYGETFEYSATDGRFVYRKGHFMHDRYKSALEVSFCPPPEHWKSFIQPALQACNFMAWEDVYHSGMIDGRAWSMDIWTGGNRIRRMSGGNNYPEEWDIFQRFMSVCLEKYCGFCEFPNQDMSLSKKIQSCIKLYHISPSELAEQLNTTTEKIKKWKTDSSELYGLSRWKEEASKPEGLVLMKMHEKIDYIIDNARKESYEELFDFVRKEKAKRSK
jgi:hypothetical protein